MYVVDEHGFWDEMDVQGHLTLEEALIITKGMMAERLIHVSLKETISKIEAPDSEFEFMELDLRDMIFDIDIFDSESELYQTLKRLIIRYWREEFSLLYYLFLNIENIKIHDDADGKTLYRHYFEGLREFRDRISFTDYLKSKVTLPIVNDYVPYIDTDQLVDYYIIDSTVKRSQLDYVLKQNNVNIKVTKENKSHWQAFGYCYGKDNGFSDLEALSFAKLISRFVSFSTQKLDKNKFIKEYLIEEEIYKKDLELLTQDLPIEKRIEKIFYELFDIYNSQITDFEYKNKRLNFRLTSHQYDQFMKVPGSNNTEKLENLIELYIDSISKNDIDLDEWIGRGDIEIVNVTNLTKKI